MSIKAKLSAAVIVSAALLPGAAIWLASEATADIMDDIFVNVLCDEAGICKTPESLVAAALKVCHDMRGDSSYTDMVAAYDIWYENPDLTQYQAGFFVGASMAAYCDEQIGNTMAASNVQPAQAFTVFDSRVGGRVG